MSADGFSWDAGPTSTLLPAVVRDLFRKSGRPVEREVDLEPLDLVREHRFTDGSSLRLPGGSRGEQMAAFDALGPGRGRQWVDHVATYADDWEVLRRGYLEVPGARTGSPARSRPGSTDARRWRAGSVAPSATSGCDWSPGTPTSPTAMTSAGCPRGSG